MFKAIADTIKPDKDFPARTYAQELRRRILDGTFYDHMPYEFFHEKHPTTGEYVPLRDRAPSIRYNMPYIVVKDSVSLLFGEGRFPTIDSSDASTREALGNIVRNCHLQQVMIDAAIAGSVGSVAVLMRVLESDGEARIHFEVLPTQYLTPVFDPNAPDTLLKVTQKIKILGVDLADIGYNIAPDLLRSEFWLQRVFDQNAETWFQPMLVAESKDKNGNPKPMIEDADRQVKHQLGFVPLVWIKNLPGKIGAIDGACTFENAIHIGIEIDYQLSQLGRGLKYSQDPLLVIKDSGNEPIGIQREASTALTLDETGDAELLELNGKASDAVINFCRTLREMALESVGGNRTPIDKLSLPQSGKAMEVLWMPLISLADTLRGSYGEYGLKCLLKMVLKAQAKLGNLQAGDYRLPKMDSRTPISLRWTDFFAATDSDKQIQAQALAELKASGLISRETCVKTLAQRYDIEAVDVEITQIEADQKAMVEAQALAAVDAKKNIVPDE